MQYNVVLDSYYIFQGILLGQYFMKHDCKDLDLKTPIKKTNFLVFFSACFAQNSQVVTLL